jgi:hypothetical protein
VGSVAEQLAGKEPQTQFGRAMKQLGVELILANSPQAKGRVERMNGVLQDRLVKALRLAGINDRNRANEFLAKKYLPGFNRKFQVEPASPADAHRAIPPRLDEVLSWEVERVVQKDWTVACDGKWRQLDQQHEALSLAGKKVIVRTLRDGRVQLERGGRKLRWKELSRRPERVEIKALRAEKKAEPWKPTTNHPWRGLRIGSQRARLALGDSVRPPLRSGLTPSPNAKDKTKPITTPTKGTLSPELLRGHF